MAILGAGSHWSADNNTNLARGLQWSDYAIAGPFIGERNFATLSAKAKILNKMGKAEEATDLMQEATTMGNVAEVHNYAAAYWQMAKLRRPLKSIKPIIKNTPRYLPVTWVWLESLAAKQNTKRL